MAEEEVTQPDPSDDALDLDSFGGDGTPVGLDDDDDKDPESPALEDEKPEGEKAAAGDEAQDGEGATDLDDDGDMVTIGGEKIPISDLTTEQIRKMATHDYQVGRYQKLADDARTEVTDRDERIAALEVKNREVTDEWTRFKMNQEAAEQAARSSPTPQAPPSTEQLKGVFAGQLKTMKEAGTITEDEYDEHQGLIANWMYRDLQHQNTLQEVAKILDERLQVLEGTVPETAQAVHEQEGERRARLIQQEAASVEGYEALAEPEEWAGLMEFIQRKVSNSPKDNDGNPLFDPLFDGETMREQYDAKNGAIMRSALTKKKAQAEADKKKDALKGTDAKSGGGGQMRRKPPAKQSGDRTPEEEALSFSDPMMATG